jgi:hypothetical protein
LTVTQSPPHCLASDTGKVVSARNAVRLIQAMVIRSRPAASSASVLPRTSPWRWSSGFVEAAEAMLPASAVRAT